MVECQLPKLNTRVRFPSLALYIKKPHKYAVLFICGTKMAPKRKVTSMYCGTQMELKTKDQLKIRNYTYCVVPSKTNVFSM